MANVQVIQSHRQPLPATWYQICIDSVRDWAARHGYDYRWFDDDLFQLLPSELQLKTADRQVVAADLARLRALRQSLEQGYEKVVWIDADTLVLAPERLHLPDGDHGFGREIWVQQAGGDARSQRAGRLRVYNKIHNAFMTFSRGNRLLDFYSYAAERLVLRHRGDMVPQLVGPKFLATLHNLLDLQVVEEAGVMCPLVAAELLGHMPDHGAVDRYLERMSVAPAALNLCGSMVRSEQLSDRDMERLIPLLQQQTDLLVP